MKRIAPLVACALLLSGTSCGIGGCDDSDDPTNPTSCSYDPELVAIAEDLDANVGQSYSTEEGAEAYLGLSPPVVQPGELPRMTMVNGGELDVAYGTAHSLTKGERILAWGCDDRITTDVLEPGERSEPLRVGPCEPPLLKPGFYGVDTSVVFGDAEEGQLVSVSSYFEVRRMPEKQLARK